MAKILLFDIDGTLLRINRGFTRKLLADLMNELELNPSILETTPFAGRTDLSIFRGLLGDHCNDDRKFQKLKQGYISRMRETLERSHIRMYPDVTDTLHYFYNRNIRMGLLTGNFREIAQLKLSLTDLNLYFGFGAFGCDHTDRNKLGRVAMESFHLAYEEHVRSTDFVIIGDTPLDIACAKTLGCAVVAVTTGHYNEDELLPHEPDLILDNLNNPEKWMQELEKKP